MKVIDLIRLLRKHLVLLLVSPILLAGLVTFLTRNPDYKFASETTFYTGIATGSSVEMDKSVSYFATSAAFDNLINIIKARETQQEVAIRLLSLHLLLDRSNPKYISEKSFSELKRITPGYIDRLVHSTQPTLSKPSPSISNQTDTVSQNTIFSFNDKEDIDSANPLPESISRDVYEETVRKLTEYMQSSDTNFVYRLLSFDHPHYSIKAISTVNVVRIMSSDMVRLRYETDDPGICQQTLAVLTEVCIKNYKAIKENRSDAVVKYFEFQLKQAAARLKVAEDKLLEFNKNNNIINYYEQSKAVAVVKEDLDVEYNNKRIKLAGIQAAIKRLEEKLGNQQQKQLTSSSIIEKRNRLGELNYQISSTETFGLTNTTSNQKLVDLKVQAEKLKDEIKVAVGELYSMNNSTEGLPISTILNDWIFNVIEAENIKAGISVLGDRIKEFQKQYAIYAPAGANIKRIEREITVSEQEFLEILHGLNLAKLKMQDNELASNIKAVDTPFFPISPIPTKRKILIIAAALLGFLIVLTTIFILEYFDTTLRKPAKASKLLKLPNLGVLPKILLDSHKINLPFITNRLLEIAIQNIEMNVKASKPERTTRTLLFFSTLAKEGKSVIAGNLALKLKMQGNKVLILSHLSETLMEPEFSQNENINASPIRKQKGVSIINSLLGYDDTRIDSNSPFLRHPKEYLAQEEYMNYKITGNFYSVNNYLEILEQNNITLSFIPDFVLIELPPILFYPYPVGLISNADLPILICRSNRVWSEADQGVLDVLMKLTEKKTHYILNGVETLVLESVLGDLPRKRSWLRRAMKNLFRFQIFSKNQL
jgi:uncharacterized protein involved in exopolysaccharide biosynthesis